MCASQWRQPLPDVHMRSVLHGMQVQRGSVCRFLGECTATASAWWCLHDFAACVNACLHAPALIMESWRIVPRWQVSEVCEQECQLVHAWYFHCAVPHFPQQGRDVSRNASQCTRGASAAPCHVFQNNGGICSGCNLQIATVACNAIAPLDLEPKVGMQEGCCTGAGGVPTFVAFEGTPQLHAEMLGRPLKDVQLAMACCRALADAISRAQVPFKCIMCSMSLLTILSLTG